MARTTGRKRLERETGHVHRGGNGGKGRKLSERKVPGVGKPGTPLDHYQPKKDALAIAIHRLAKKGDSRRRIAKQLGISRERVDAVLDA